uniref:Uncharacterized protein n=1 Tax=Vespula pensylvanica TaxID=30213 RepID=A0A834PAK6_VESPE|nr:hypothetical protein H0235_002737 [Vespula pensylvanica]
MRKLRKTTKLVKKEKKKNRREKSYGQGASVHANDSVKRRRKVGIRNYGRQRTSAGQASVRNESLISSSIYIRSVPLAPLWEPSTMPM